MAAPEYVPTPVDTKPRGYESSPWEGVLWMVERPAETVGSWPQGPRLGYPGPDPGYALKLVKAFEGRLVLTPGEDEHDVITGCTRVAMKRAALLGRAPVMNDLTVAFTLWGFLAEADPELVKLRRPLFRAVAHPHHYFERRRIADVVPAAVLKLTPAEVARIAATDWQRFFKRRAK